MPEQLAMNFAAPSHAQRVATARKLGEERGVHCRNKADVVCPDFAERALNFIAEYARKQATFTGEDATNAAKMSGIRPHDDRAFGPVYAKALRENIIRVVGFVPRVKGHGSAGGKLYARVVQ